MKEPQLPDYVTRIGDQEPFNFACHPKVDCFTHCCRELELALTPYDVLRLRKSVNMHSRKLIDSYIIVEQTCNDIFPRLYLTMVDDGQASCVFVSDKGCTVYENRPGACRAYPMGRAAMQQDDGSLKLFHVLVKEDHCRGFKEPVQQTIDGYTQDQKLGEYNRFNDLVAQILQHPEVRKGKSFTKRQINYFTLGLYDLDTFRERLLAANLENTLPLTEEEKNTLEDDESLLLYGIDWVKKQLFDEALAD